MYASFEPKVHVTADQQVFVITVRGEVDYDDTEEFEAAREAADRAALPTTAVDLSQVTFADSMLLNALLSLRHRHEAAGRALVLLGPLQPAVDRLLSVSGTLEHFTITSIDGGRPAGPTPGPGKATPGAPEPTPGAAEPGHGSDGRRM